MQVEVTFDDKHRAVTGLVTVGLKGAIPPLATVQFTREDWPCPCFISENQKKKRRQSTNKVISNTSAKFEVNKTILVLRKGPADGQRCCDVQSCL